MRNDLTDLTDEAPKPTSTPTDPLKKRRVADPFSAVAMGASPTDPLAFTPPPPPPPGPSDGSPPLMPPAPGGPPPSPIPPGQQPPQVPAPVSPTAPLPPPPAPYTPPVPVPIPQPVPNPSPMPAPQPPAVPPGTVPGGYSPDGPPRTTPLPPTSGAPDGSVLFSGVTAHQGTPNYATPFANKNINLGTSFQGSPWEAVASQSAFGPDYLRNTQGFAASYLPIADQIRGKGYAMNNQGDIIDPTTRQVVGNFLNDAAFDIGNLPTSGRGDITPAAEDQTQGNAERFFTGLPSPAPVGEEDQGPDVTAGMGLQPAPPSLPGRDVVLGGGTPAPYTPATPATDFTKLSGTPEVFREGAPGLSPVGVGTSPSGNTSGNTPLNTANPLTHQRLQVGPLADRFAIAQQKLDAFRKANDPAFQADLRDARRIAASAGALGSGKLQSSIGDVVSNRRTREDAAGMGFLADALSGTIGDEFAKTGIDQQQQGFQAGRQDRAFDEAQTLRALQEALTQGQHNRSLDTLNAGNTGDPSNLWATLSQIFGSQSSAAGQSLADLIRAQTSTPTGGANVGSGGMDWSQLLAALQRGMSGSGTVDGQGVP